MLDKAVAQGGPVLLENRGAKGQAVIRLGATRCDLLLVVGDKRYWVGKRRVRYVVIVLHGTYRGQDLKFSLFKGRHERVLGQEYIRVGYGNRLVLAHAVVLLDNFIDVNSSSVC